MLRLELYLSLDAPEVGDLLYSDGTFCLLLMSSRLIEHRLGEHHGDLEDAPVGRSTVQRGCLGGSSYWTTP